MSDVLDEKLKALVAQARANGRLLLRNELAKMFIAADMVDAARLVINYPVEEPTRTKACGRGRG